MAKTKSTKPKAKRKPPVERVRVQQTTSVVFPARNCSGSEISIKGVHEDGVIKFYERRSYGSGWSTESIGTGVRLDVLEAVVEKLKENS